MVSQAVKSYVKKVTAKQKPEMKVQSFTEANETVMNTLSTQYLFQEFTCSQGLGNAQRIGNEILLQGFHTKGVLHNNSTGTIWVRKLILGYSDSIQDGAFTELFRLNLGTTGDLTTVVGLDVIYRPINKVKFHVYKDQVHKLSSNADTAGNHTKFFNDFQKFGGSKIKYEANTGGFTNQDKRFCILWLVADANDDTSLGNPIELSNITSWYFTDP